VRQLENTCRWLTVMASGREIHIDDLPPELRADRAAITGGNDDWERALEVWAEAALIEPSAKPLLDTAMPRFERIIIRAALKRTGGRKRDAAELLGWGRNTLTRKITELEMTDP
jgi:two-component system nitrogen regulation response regulator GlnG